MLKKGSYSLLLVVMLFALCSCAGQTKHVGDAMTAENDGLPESVMKQSQKDMKQSEGWEKYDKSGAVKFLQVEHTAAASPEGSGEKLDGSIGERLLEIKLMPEVAGEMVEWTLKNAGPSPVWIVATGTSNSEAPIIIQPEQEMSLATDVVDGYCYLVVDNEGGKETTLSIKATCAETDAKTVRGKNMKIVWF